jgi:hypothetical protein
MTPSGFCWRCAACSLQRSGYARRKGGSDDYIVESACPIRVLGTRNLSAWKRRETPNYPAKCLLKGTIGIRV